MTEWQPIETAPKDGTEILIAMPNDDGSWYIRVSQWGGIKYKPLLDFTDEGWRDPDDLGEHGSDVSHWAAITPPTK